MKTIFSLSLLMFLYGCSLTDSGIVVNTPTIPSINFCQNVATDADVASMKASIDAQSFKDDRMNRAKLVTMDYCFISSQVVSIMESMVFEDARLEIAKELYDQTTDKKNYTLCVDFLKHKSDKDELREFMLMNP